MILGAHISKEKTIVDTMETIKKNGGNALQLFVSNPRSGKVGDINKYKKEAAIVKEYCQKNNFSLVVHSAYTINLAKEFKNDKRQIEIGDCYWIQLLLYELEVADIIGAVGCVVHVGKYTTQSPEDGLKNMKAAIKYIVEELKSRKISSRLILETPSGQGTELLVNLSDFLEFYNSFTSNEKEYLGICLDTCHVWSAGYELSEAITMIYSTNKKDLVVVHLNNSKKGKGSKVDQHEYLLEGKIPLNKIKDCLSMIKEKILILEMPSDDIGKKLSWIKLNK